MPAKIHKKPSPGSAFSETKESYAKEMFTFIGNKSETSRRSILMLFETMSQIDLTKISISKIKSPTILYIKTLNELMERINNNKIVFRVTPVVLCAQMIAETARIFSISSGLNIDIFQLLLNNDKKMVLPSENDISPFPVRKVQKLHSYSPLLAFIIKHYPQAGNVKDIFCYALITMFERMKLKSLIPRVIPSFPVEKYTPVSHECFDCAEATPESLLEVGRKLKSPMDPVLVLLVRFISCKIFGSYDFNYTPVNELLDTAFEFLEENPDFEIDSLTPLLLYYSSLQVNFPIHLTYTSVNHCLFLICIGLRNLFEPTTNDILLSTISFENAPCPSLALVFAHNLAASFIPEFISHALKCNLTPEWDEEIKYLLQYVKLPPKVEDLVEQSKTNNLDAIKFLLKDTSCISLLEPDQYQSHKLLLLFLKPIESPLPEKINFDRYDAAFIYRLKSLKDQPDSKIIANYIHQSAEMLKKITLNICNDNNTLFHAIYSGIQPSISKSDTLEHPLPPPPQIKKSISAEFFFLTPLSPEFENISLIIDNLLNIINEWKFNFDEDQDIIQIVADFNRHYYLAINHSDRCSKVFGIKYKKAYERQPYDHFIKAFQEETTKNKKGKLITIFRPIISLQTSQSCMLDFIKRCYELNDQEAFTKIIKIMPNISSLDSLTISNEELLDIIKTLIYADISKNVIQISTKLIENEYSKQVYQLFLSAAFDHTEVITSICNNLPTTPEFAEYFFNNSLNLIPDEISYDLSNLLYLLSRQIKPSEYELPNYPKLKVNDVEWKEDRLKLNKNQNNETKPKAELGEEISISIKKQLKTAKPKKARKYSDDMMEEEEEEEEEVFDEYLDNSITITNSSISGKGKNYEFPFSSKNCPSIWEIPNIKHCTFIETGNHYTTQPYFRCQTCNFSSDEGVCEYCAVHCHKGHQIYYDGKHNCYCDCFADPSRCISHPDHKNFAHNHRPTHNHTGTFGKTNTYGVWGSKSRPTNTINKPISTISNNNSYDERNSKTKIVLGSKCIIDIFLKIARTIFSKLEIENIKTLQLKQLKSVKGFNQFNLSPNFSFPQTPSYSQLRKRISRVKNFSSLLERRSNYKSISLACNIGNDIICYSNGSGLYATKMSQKPPQRSTGFFASSKMPSSSSIVSTMPFDECIYSIVSSGDSLVACLCDSVVKIVKITPEQQQSQTAEVQSNEQRFLADQILQLQQIENPSPSQTLQLERLQRIQNLHQQIQNGQSQESEIQQIQQQINQLQQQIQENNQDQSTQVVQIQMLQHLRLRLNTMQNQSRQQNQTRFKFELIASLATHQTSPTQHTDAAASSASDQSPSSFAFSSPQRTTSSPAPQRSSIYIDAIFVDNQHIIILTGSSITTYSLPSGTQITRIKATRVPFTSMCLFDYNEKRHVLTGNSEGQLILYTISQDGILTLDHVVGIDNPDSPVIVSCSNEDDLIFISTDKHPLSVCRPTNLFNALFSPIQIEGLTSSVTLYGRYKGTKKDDENTDNNETSVFIFTKTKNGSICSVEFTSNSFVVSSLNDDFRTEDCNQPCYLGSFDSSLGFYALSSDGVFLNVTLSENRTRMTRSQSNELASSMAEQRMISKQEENVPVTFWSRTLIATRDIVNLYANEMDDASSLLEGRTVNVPQSLTLRFTVRPTSNDFTIVGIRINTLVSSSSSSQRCAEVNGRMYPLGGPIPTLIPLKPNEVHPGSSVGFTILPGGGMMILKSIQIHYMNTDELTVPRSITPRKIFDWMSESTDLLDFCEASIDKIPKDDQKQQILLNLARGFNDDGKITEDCIKFIIVTMYECGEQVALQSRLILAKLKFDHDVIQKIWAESIEIVVKKKSIHQSQINALWRDFTLLDSRFKGEIHNLVWNNIQEQSGLSCLLSAFY